MLNEAIIAHIRSTEISAQPAKMVTVLYHIENHRDREVTIVGVFSDENPGSGKIYDAKRRFMAARNAVGIKCEEYEFRTREGALDDYSTWDPF